ncbi:MAG: AraC family transcriptional regulator [Acidimicrobiales bacterium]
MSAATINPPPSADPLGEILHMLRLTGTLYCRADFTAPWGVDLPEFDDAMVFEIVTEGSCWLEIDGSEPRRLEQGSLTLIPHGTPHRVRSDLDATAIELFDLPVVAHSERYESVSFGGGGAATQITCGVVRLDHAIAHQLVAQLPSLIHIDAWRDDDSSWLHHTLRFITREARELRPGGDTVITRLADILVIQAIRAWIDSSPSAETGWLAALRDPRIGPALQLIHEQPDQAWTVASLARASAMSRSAFSARFTRIVGVSAMTYLADWRMHRAREQLRDTTDPVAAIAARVGYQSEASFCRAYKRTFGTSPGHTRRDAG